MSYEIFRADFASRVLPLLPDESILPKIMHVLDQSAANYDFVTRCTDLIVTDGLPEIVRLYIATKSISNIKKGTLDNYYSLLKIFFQTVKKPLDQITATDIRLFLAWYKNTRKVKDSTSEVSLMAYLYSRKDNSPVLFAPVRGEIKHLNKKTIEEEIRRIVSRCEISVHVTPHIFRHTAASLALQRGMPIEQVQKFLGHARIQTTLRYAKVLDFEVKLNHQKYVA